MGKKTKDQEPVANLNNVSNRDIIQRINFLYQASTYLSTVAPSPPDVVAPPIQTKSGSRRRKKNKVRHPMSAAELSRSYVNTMRIVGQKSMVRMDPSIKRTLCKQCDAVLILGSTASVRVKPSRSHGQAVVYTCLSCKSFRVIPAPEVLDPDAPKADDVLLDSNDGAVASTSTGIGEHASAIDIDPTPSALAHTKKKKKKKKKALQSRKRAACVLPHFERKGHVIFRGNEILTRT